MGDIPVSPKLAPDGRRIAVRSIRLCPTEVHLWSAWLDVPRDQLVVLARTLSDDERARAARFRFTRHARRFVASRGILRSILSRYLGVDPRAVRFHYQSHGKPVLGPGFEGSGIQFNVSHSEDLAIYAVSRCRVGVDVERVRPMPDALSVAQSVFSAREIATLLGLPDDHERELAFLRCWTRKEAFVKALGQGLTVPLDCFDVALAPGDPVELLEVRGQQVTAEQWRLMDLNLGDGAIGAVAIERACDRPTFREWNDP